MSDNESEEEQQQQMEKIFICVDVWHGIFAFLCPFELGLKMALISDRLDVLVDVHFKSRKWSFGWMEILRANGGNGAEIVNKRSGERLPIPQGPIPSKVIGFKHIEISYVDQTVIEFLQRIFRFFASSGTNVYIQSSDDQSRSWEIIRQNIWPLVNDNICGLSLDSSQLDRLRQISPTILRNCPNLRSIDSFDLFPELTTEDNADASSAQAVVKWLITPRADCLPKMFDCGCYLAGIEGLENSFDNASESVNFIIRFLHSPIYGIEPFELKNNLTGEQLTLRQIDEDYWLLVRCPIEREEDKWTNWEEGTTEWEWFVRQWNLVIVSFNDSDIGDGMVEANEGPSEPTE
uniref:Uncharacterized protein n=1 Tax=Globodera rostochiensis TaxID=31243 RepID=A0A914HTM7_GLORO